MMKFITPIYLKGEETPFTDAAGDTTYEPKLRKVLANQLSIGQTEFYQAHSTGFKPEIKLEVRTIEYNNESELKLGKYMYKIIRTYDKKNGVTELTCSKGVNDAVT